MALRIVHTPAARLDLLAIWSYIADDSEVSADQLLRRIDDVVIMLSERPHAGRLRSELHPDIRSFPVGNYILFYRVVSGAIDVVRVLSRFRDIDHEEFQE
jgi:toxin ParE1/3/4